MALLPTGFKERLEQMELCRIQRLSLLQAEKELQFTKSQLLASKISSIKSADHRCLNLQQQIANKHFVISSLKSRIDLLDTEYLDVSQQVRVLKSEVQELEELEREKERYFDSEIKEMEGFKAEVEKFTDERRREVQELKNQAEQLKSSFVKLQGNIGCSDDSELAAAEIRKSELLAEKENLDCRLASSYQIRAQLQRQLQSILMTQSQAGKKCTYSSQMRCLKP
ncbi:putative kinetochore protein NDC80 [Heracleum sosnowskyi]|uniref:Kinetochore protein NDC80 n=1 Tax=Heracleum sosnowskyi TaxID=360622 RepID=A0AAD8HKF0_9APIA|nr:putative kinetochore protein NDC80 [Heracleum sosnowskyi]